MTVRIFLRSLRHRAWLTVACTALLSLATVPSVAPAQSVAGGDFVRAASDGSPIVTDGPFPEAKEFLAGYWIVDVESAEEAYKIAARASLAPAPAGTTETMPLEVRQVLSGAPEEFL